MADTVGYLFLGQVIVMALLVVWLFVETLRDDAQTRRDRKRGYTVHRESLFRELCIYAIVSSLFALSYIARFTLNDYFVCNGNNAASVFAHNMAKMVCYLFEGASMGGIICSHMYYMSESMRNDCRSSSTEEGEHELFTRDKE